MTRDVEKAYSNMDIPEPLQLILGKEEYEKRFEDI